MAAAPDGPGGPGHLGIEARGLTRAYGTLVAASNVDLNVVPGSVTGLLGPNGAGKTTTLRVLATLLRPSAGTATVGGHDILTEPELVRRRLGYLTGDTGLYGKLTPVEMLRYFGRLHQMSAKHLAQRIEEVVVLLGIESFRGRHCEKLSTGQKQRVSIARAVLHDPAVLILDEPTSGLDILAASEMLQFFRAEADRGKAVLLSTHHMAEVELICDHAVIIHHGTVRHAGTLAELTAAAGGESLSRGFFALLGESDRGVSTA